MSLANVPRASPVGTLPRPQSAENDGSACMTGVLTTLHVLHVCKNRAHVGAAYALPRERRGRQPA